MRYRMLQKLYIIIPKELKADYYLKQRFKNRKNILFTSIIVLLIQIFILLNYLVNPFSLNGDIMYYYYLFYIFSIILNTSFIIATSIYYLKHKNLNITISILIRLHLTILHTWAMGVAIADQFQGQDIVVYYSLILVFERKITLLNFEQCNFISQL